MTAQSDPAQATVRPYLTETFTGATTVPGFVASGSACLTGAPAGAAQAVPGCSGPSAGPVPPVGAAPHGFLQLTNALNNQSGAVLYDVPIPAAEGLSVTFEQWQYGSTIPPIPGVETAADGIAFFLADGSLPLKLPGAYGGSLGYAQKWLADPAPGGTWIPGVAGGYLGVGLDVLGNYFDDSERRGWNCAQAAPAGVQPGAATRPGEPEKITVRGGPAPGDSTLTNGYCFLTSTYTTAATNPPSFPSSLPAGSLHGDVASVSADPVRADADLAPARRTVNVRVTPAPDARVIISLAGASGALVPVLDFAAPKPLPASYKFGFTAGTGTYTDVHLIRNVAIESSPLLDLTKTLDRPGPYALGDTVGYTFHVRNLGAPVTDLKVADERIPDVTCDRNALGRDEETSCHGTYVVSAADRAAGGLTNVATATAAGPSGPESSPVAQVAAAVEPTPVSEPAPQDSTAVAAETVPADAPAAVAVQASPTYTG